MQNLAWRDFFLSQFLKLISQGFPRGFSLPGCFSGIALEATGLKCFFLLQSARRFFFSPNNGTIARPTYSRISDFLDAHAIAIRPFRAPKFRC